MNKQPLVSICIPTYKRADILRETLKSIYSQEIDHMLFEVCISDDSPDDQTRDMVESEFGNIDNLIYKKVPDCGFYNLINALKMGKGELLKLQNDYAMFNDGTLEKLISIVKENRADKPLVFFALGSAKGLRGSKEYHDFDQYIKDIDIQCTFCSAISIWKTDFDKLEVKKQELNAAFPHTTLLFKQASKNTFIIDNNTYFTNAELKNKGGYNLPEYFIKEYTGMLKSDLLSKGYITERTYAGLVDNALKFTASCYWNIKYDSRLKIGIDNYETYIKEACGSCGYKKFVFYKSVEFIKKTIKLYVYKFLHKKI